MTEIPNLPDEQELATPENFDLNAWVSGIQPTTRAVNIYGRADLIAEIEMLEAKLKIAEAAADSGEESLDDAGSVADLEARLTQRYQEFVDSGITFKVQGRSENWLDAVEKRCRNSARVNGASKDEKTVFVQLNQLAESIVQPEGVTYEHLAALREVSESQVRKLLVAFSLACNQAPQVTAPFSQRSSGGRRTRQR